MEQGQQVTLVDVVCVVPLFAPVCDDRDIIEDNYSHDIAQLGVTVDEVFSTYGDDPEEDFDAIVLSCSFEHGEDTMEKLKALSEQFLLGHIALRKTHYGQ